MRSLLQRLGIALGLTLTLAFIFILVWSRQPAQALRAFFLSPFLNRNVFLSMLEQAAPLLLCSLGALVAFRAGHFSLGGEGQLYAGACLAALVGGGLARWLPAAATASTGVWLTLAAQGAVLLAGMAGGLLVAAPPALGSRLAGADVLLTSFLVSQAAILVVDSLIGGALRDTANNLVAMPTIADLARLPRLARPSALTSAPFIALAACLWLWFFMERSRGGRKLSLYGKNRAFAGLMGYPVRRLAWSPMLAAGALHGLAGASLVQGVNGTAIRGMSGGLGWSAIGVALIASNRPALVPAAALLFAWLDSGARQASVLADIPVELSLIVKATVIMGITLRPLWRSLRAKRFTGERL
ncbi:MAG: hypothetical protein A2087_08535 [Spirochaetes bacterium GWD1_61_31]|nr:MAG: hypothetical protein A2Y37_13280 [Spirochaetes bacterium GWB1_60_80]OHD35496.1 MAG: hypothetical protein A2004_08595 [Spirochaetes bacterium GWC1_61_12]OHD36719.1 MAG: hypothetical protein A2087_08535 [Spirochaetes bacterium GWD1_61_31]OHD42523.1 MAG: hypothetical protein A2Y35_08075 [Spirochaetes bacterium GWE1_60_18]OHD58252.1 MAG: hypothetical protein A2Y32_04995 [Spirochaetes bacterium GWF1_60_12]HAP44311.1 hypothetical protein [Spirochaetaceae bacterium]